MQDIKLGYDIDGVLAEFWGHFMEYFNFSDKSDPTEWDDLRVRGNFHKTHSNKDFWLSMPVIIDAHELPIAPHCYVTARPIPNEWSMEWLWKHKFPYAPLHTVGVGNSKIKVLKMEGVTHFIDDAVHNFYQLNNNGVPCLLKTRSHNVEEDTKLRVDTLSDIPRVIASLESQ